MEQIRLKKLRLDILMHQKGLAESRNKAQRMIMAGEVKVNGSMQLKPSFKMNADALIEVAEKQRFVSRGGLKLEPALEKFGFSDLSGTVCADVGASTGGFTDCLLQHGAEKVYAIDVGYGILHWELRKNPRVVVMERTNARYLESLPEAVSLVTMDASFISLQLLLPVVKEWLTSSGDVVALVKPQFEAGRKDAAKNAGVIRNPEVHQRVLIEVAEFAIEHGFQVMNLAKSSIIGPKGNVEFLMHLTNHQSGKSLEALKDQAQRLAPIEPLA